MNIKKVSRLMDSNLKTEWEFCSFILVCQSTTLQQLSDLITDKKQQYLDSFIIILCCVYKANLTCELPKHRQYITYPTRDSNILDHCYFLLKDAYHCPPGSFGTHHCLVHFLPFYRQKFKSVKPVIRTVKRWTNKTEQEL